MRFTQLQILAAVAVVALAVSACANFRVPEGTGRPEGVARLARGYGDVSFKRLTADMTPSMMAIAKRHDGLASKDSWGRVPGWETYDLSHIPVLGVGALSAEEARAINALKTASDDPPPPAKAFILKANALDRAAAVRCLTQAIYYEAATEPLEGKEAVAQTVLNRVRHPGYPKSICGVVYQGSLRATGCQFSFTCDGSLARPPLPWIWSESEKVANRALNGFVLKSVGTATHYHADYVAPYWAPTLFKITQIGRHIFYRWTGPWGLPPAFKGRYAGGEANLSQAILQGLDARTQGLRMLGGAMGDGATGVQPGRTVMLSLDGEMRPYTIASPSEPGAEGVRPSGGLVPTRRTPTPEEVAEINAKLKALEDDPDAPIATAPRGLPPPAEPPPGPTAGDLPIGRRPPGG